MRTLIQSGGKIAWDERRIVSFLWGLAISLSVLCAVSADAERLRVLTYNIHHGEGTDGKFDYERLAGMINGLNPDVVALQEVDRKTGRVNGVDQAARLAALCEMNFVFGAAMPYDGGEYGEAVLSRFPIEHSRNHPLPFEFGQEPRIVLAARIVPDNGLPSFDFLGTHLCHQSESTRTQQVQQIRQVFGGDEDVPVILAGDLNARPSSVPIQTLLADDWIDAVAPQSMIDYILIRCRDAWRVVEVDVVDDLIISDHRPVLVELEWLEDREERVNATPTGLEDLLAMEDRLQSAIASVEKAIVVVNGGNGGGVLVSPDGYVLTAAHVSGTGRDIRIRLADGSNHDARSLGAFRFADAAMVKIDGEGPFPYVPLAGMDQTRVGEWCFALGHPGGLDDDRGVVARIGRIILQKDNLMRSDCCIIGGDSGSALFNMRGELIGIHSRIGGRLDQNYHAPIKAFLRHWKPMKEGVVIPPNRMRGRRGGLGVRTVDANPGVRVVRVEREDSPLKRGDIIRQVDEFVVEDDWEYLVALSSRRVGEVVRLRVLRESEWIDVEAKLERFRGRRQ
ncbi:MAG: Periplasmic serine endoprotease DegP [Verrucomicrobia subdivision 3 bacterium]|nr:Periplasmic serine endoprotease DegP [Limisphaerales bacterium]MCS1416691.1 Periplasmic serine endoprotease DegP [Limisphaerales bacterium]